MRGQGGIAFRPCSFFLSFDRIRETQGLAGKEKFLSSSRLVISSRKESIRSVIMKSQKQEGGLEYVCY